MHSCKRFLKIQKYAEQTTKLPIASVVFAEVTNHLPWLDEDPHSLLSVYLLLDKFMGTGIYR